MQIYVGKKKSKVKRALKELKGFQKVFIDKGATKSFEIFIKCSDLSYYDETISNWNFEKGKYIIYIGNSSNNISKEIEITIK